MCIIWHKASITLIYTHIVLTFGTKKKKHIKLADILTSIGDNAVTSSIRIAQVFFDLAGKKTRALWKVYREMLKFIINYAFYLAHYRHIFI